MREKPMLPLLAASIAAALLFVTTACGAAGGAFAPSERTASDAPAKSAFHNLSAPTLFVADAGFVTKRFARSSSM